MFFKKRYEAALNAYNAEVKVLQNVINETKQAESAINSYRISCKPSVSKIDNFINSIVNTPKEFSTEVESVNSHADSILANHNTEQYVHNLQVSLEASNFLLLFGATMLVAAGSSLAQNSEPSENDASSSNMSYDENNMSDGSSCALESGGCDDQSSEDESGIKGAIQLLAAAVGGLSLLGGTAIRPISYYTKSNEIFGVAENIKEDCGKLRKYILTIKEVEKETEATHKAITLKLDALAYLHGADYSKISEDERTFLWAFIKDIRNFMCLLNKTVEVE